MEKIKIEWFEFFWKWPTLVWMFLADLYIELTCRRIWKSILNLPSSDIDESAMKGLYYHCWTPKCRSTTCVCVQKMSATLPLWDIAYYRNKLFHPILLFLQPYPLCVTISVSFWNSRNLSSLSGTLSFEPNFMITLVDNQVWLSNLLYNNSDN